jgi:hypothetical protein
MGAAIPGTIVVPSLATLAWACLAPPQPGLDAADEAQWLCECRLEIAGAFEPRDVLEAWRTAPPAADAALATLAAALELGLAEQVAVALVLAAESEVPAARALAWLQAPHHEPWPTVGLVTCVAGLLGDDSWHARSSLLDGPALASGLLRLETRGRALPDAIVTMPLPLVLAATQGVGRWPGVELGTTAPTLAPSLRDAVAAQARGLDARGSLAVTSADPHEARAAAAAVARALGAMPAFIDGEVPAGLGPWLVLRGAMPVQCGSPAPGERRRADRPRGYRGPVLMAGGIDGGWELDDVPVPGWRVPLPTRDERAAFWKARDLTDAQAQALARRYRHGEARLRALAELGQARARAEAAPALAAAHVVGAARDNHAVDLGVLGEALRDDVGDDALVLPAALRRELEALARRCEVRDGLADDLGPAARTRYRAGVRALFVGASGTGKTLSASWLATRLGLPLHRVDLAAVTSKYIGETEKNLAELFARAEHAQVVLLFDEADALFGKRTDVKDSNDRHANQQTNYLLQRIESFEGIALLTSNSRARFDTAFTRRLDCIVEFPSPTAEERRALWLAHLGTAHALGDAELNRLAASCDLAGGHIRNVVLGARALAGGGLVAAAGLEEALAAEYRKLGKLAPAGMVGR